MRVASQPTLIVAFGSTRSVLLRMADELDSGLDPEVELGIRGLADGDDIQGRHPWVTAVAADQLADAFAHNLKELLEPPGSNVWQNVYGAQLVCVADEAQLGQVAAFLAEIRKSSHFATVVAALHDRGGVEATVLVKASSAESATDKWAASGLGTGASGGTPCVVIASHHAGRHLQDGELNEALAIALRILAMESYETRHQVLPGAGRAPVLSRWDVVELVDHATTLDLNRQRLEFANRVRQLLEYPLATLATGQLPATELLLAWTGGDSAAGSRQGAARSNPIIAAAWRAADTELVNTALEIAARPDPLAGIDAGDWPSGTVRGIRAACQSTLANCGDAKADRLLKESAAAFTQDAVVLETLHEKLGWCGTTSLLAELERLQRGLTNAKTDVKSKPVLGEAGGDFVAGLAALQVRWREEVGPDPPRVHLTAIVWIACGLLLTPMLQSLANWIGQPVSGTRNLTWMLQTIAWGALNDVGSLGVGAALGLGAHLLVQWFLRRRRAAIERRILRDVQTILKDVATSSRGLQQERERLRVRVQAALVTCADAAEHALRRRMTHVKEVQRSIAWLVKRLQGNAMPIARGANWTLQRVNEGRILWRLCPPSADEADQDSLPSPWASLPDDLRNMTSETAAFFLWPKKVATQLRVEPQHPAPVALPPESQAVAPSLEPLRLPRPDVAGSSAEDCFLLVGARAGRRLDGLAHNGTEPWRNAIGAPNTPLTEVFGAAGDRVLAITVVTMPTYGAEAA